MNIEELYPTDEELTPLLHNGTDWIDTNYNHVARTMAKFAVDDAVRKIVEWGNEECPHWHDPPSFCSYKRECPYCWQALKELK